MFIYLTDVAIQDGLKGVKIFKAPGETRVKVQSAFLTGTMPQKSIQHTLHSRLDSQMTIGPGRWAQRERLSLNQSKMAEDMTK